MIPCDEHRCSNPTTLRCIVVRFHLLITHLQHLSRADAAAILYAPSSSRSDSVHSYTSSSGSHGVRARHHGVLQNPAPNHIEAFMHVVLSCSLGICMKSHCAYSGVHRTTARSRRSLKASCLSIPHGYLYLRVCARQTKVSTARPPLAAEAPCHGQVPHLHMGS